MNKEKYHTVGKFPRSNTNVYVERDNIGAANTQITNTHYI